MQNPACAIVPASDPVAASAAKAVPWSRARKKTTGPEVSGRPTNQPPTPSPQRRPAKVAAWISSGLKTSFKTRVFIGGTLQPGRRFGNVAECTAPPAPRSQERERADELSEPRVAA